MLSLAERAPIYAWLAIRFSREIDAVAWAELRSEPLRSILVQLEPALAQPLSLPLSMETEEMLAEEFARLFLLPNGVSPLATPWVASMSGREPSLVRDDLTAIVRNGFEALGRKPSGAEPGGRLPLDHVALLFDLVAVSAVQGSMDSSDLAIAHHLDRELMNEWLVPFGESLTSKARHPLYGALGQLIADLHGSPAVPSTAKCSGPRVEST